MSEQEMREAFEAWFEPDEHNRESLKAWRTEDGYRTDSWYLNGCWNGWKAASERVRELEEALYGMVGLFRGTCGLKGWNQSDYIEFTNALAALKEPK